MPKNEAKLYFFVGTVAELIKVFPVMIEAGKRGISYKLIASGQNDISKCDILNITNGGRIDIQLSDPASIRKSSLGLLKWFVQTKKKAKKLLQEEFSEQSGNKLMVVHGDTVSTMMGAMIAKKFRLQVAHVEAGLRSFDIFNPFPEEIDRILTSRRAQIHFAPGEKPMSNLKSANGKKINTVYNTIYDSLQYSIRNTSCNTVVQEAAQNGKYFVYVMHRQENLMNKVLVTEAFQHITTISEHISCIMILHEPTRVAFENFGLMSELGRAKNILTASRMEYFDFMALLSGAQFVITDGGSNQEELSYMGKPCLLLRKKTERFDGIGENVVMYGGNLGMIETFFNSYTDYIRQPLTVEKIPSAIIMDALEEAIS